jgi:hypothetical protein
MQQHHASKRLCLKGNDGAGLAAVILITGALAGMVSLMTSKIATNSQELHRLVRNPLSVELTDLPFLQVVGDDSMCGASNMMAGMSNFSLDGVLQSQLGNKVRELDVLSVVIGSTTKDVTERKMDTAGLYTKLGLKQFEVYQLAPMITDLSSSLTRVPVGFVKVAIIPGTAGARLASTAAGTTTLGAKSGALTSGTGLETTTTTAGTHAAVRTGAAGMCAGPEAKADVTVAVNACTDVFTKSLTGKNIFTIILTLSRTKTSCESTAAASIRASRSPDCAAFVSSAITAGLKPMMSAGVSAFFSGGTASAVTTGIAALSTAALAVVNSSISSATIAIVASKESIPAGWSGNPKSGKFGTSEVMTADGESYSITRTIEAMMYVEMAADKVTPMACYSSESSRSLCLDLGGIFSPTAVQKCQLAASVNALSTTVLGTPLSGY